MAHQKIVRQLVASLELHAQQVTAVHQADNICLCLLMVTHRMEVELKSEQGGSCCHSMHSKSALLSAMSCCQEAEHPHLCAKPSLVASVLTPPETTDTCLNTSQLWSGH